jgi:protein-L-isoaspartate O-methyltransferase
MGYKVILCVAIVLLTALKHDGRLIVFVLRVHRQNYQVINASENWSAKQILYHKDNILKLSLLHIHA